MIQPQPETWGLEDPYSHYCKSKFKSWNLESDVCWWQLQETLPWKKNWVCASMNGCVWHFVGMYLPLSVPPCLPSGWFFPTQFSNIHVNCLSKHPYRHIQGCTVPMFLTADNPVRLRLICTVTLWVHWSRKQNYFIIISEHIAELQRTISRHTKSKFLIPLKLESTWLNTMLVPVPLKPILSILQLCVL